MSLEKKVPPDNYSANSVNCDCDSRDAPTISYRVNWGFKLIIKLSFRSDDMHINLIASFIFILQFLEEDAQNKKLCSIRIMKIKYHQIYKVVTTLHVYI